MQNFTPNLASRKGNGRRNRDYRGFKNEKEEKDDPEFKSMIAGFIEKSGGTLPEDFMDKFGKKERRKGRTDGTTHNERKALVIKKPEGVIEANIGQTILIEIEILNDTHQNLKEDVRITLDDSLLQDGALVPIKALDFPINKIVPGKLTEKFEVPLVVLDNITAGD